MMTFVATINKTDTIPNLTRGPCAYVSDK